MSTPPTGSVASKSASASASSSDDEGPLVPELAVSAPMDIPAAQTFVNRYMKATLDLQRAQWQKEYEAAASSAKEERKKQRARDRLKAAATGAPVAPIGGGLAAAIATPPTGASATAASGAAVANPVAQPLLPAQPAVVGSAGAQPAMAPAYLAPLGVGFATAPVPGDNLSMAMMRAMQALQDSAFQTVKMQADRDRLEVERRTYPFLLEFERVGHIIAEQRDIEAVRDAVAVRAKARVLSDAEIMTMSYTLFGAPNDQAFFFGAITPSEEAITIHNWTIAHRKGRDFARQYGERVARLTAPMYPADRRFDDLNHELLCGAVTAGAFAASAISAGEPYLPVLEHNGEYVIDGAPIAEAIARQAAEIAELQRKLQLYQRRRQYLQRFVQPHHRRYAYGSGASSAPEGGAAYPRYQVPLTWPVGLQLPSEFVSASAVKRSEN